MSKSLGELAFEAYVANRGGKNHDGSPTPSWADLGDGVRGGWEASALAVARRMPALEGAKFVAVKVGAFGEGPGRGAYQLFLLDPNGGYSLVNEVSHFPDEIFRGTTHKNNWPRHVGPCVELARKLNIHFLKWNHLVGDTDD